MVCPPFAIYSPEYNEISMGGQRGRKTLRLTLPIRLNHTSPKNESAISPRLRPPRPPTGRGGSIPKASRTSGPPPGVEGVAPPRDGRLAREVVLAPHHHRRGHPRRARRGGGGAGPRGRISRTRPPPHRSGARVPRPRGRAAFPAAGGAGKSPGTALPVPPPCLGISPPTTMRSPGSDRTYSDSTLRDVWSGPTRGSPTDTPGIRRRRRRPSPPVATLSRYSNANMPPYDCPYIQAESTPRRVFSAAPSHPRRNHASSIERGVRWLVRRAASEPIAERDRPVVGNDVDGGGTGDSMARDGSGPSPTAGTSVSRDMRWERDGGMTPRPNRAITAMEPPPEFGGAVARSGRSRRRRRRRVGGGGEGGGGRTTIGVGVGVGGGRRRTVAMARVVVVAPIASPRDDREGDGTTAGDDDGGRRTPWELLPLHRTDAAPPREGRRGGRRAEGGRGGPNGGSGGNNNATAKAARAG